MKMLTVEESIRVSGGVVFESRHDRGLSGLHKGWCKGLGHPESQGGGKAGGHRNHEHCSGFPEVPEEPEGA
jgi:hypothetical protein